MAVRPPKSLRFHAGSAQKQLSRSAKLAGAQGMQCGPAQALSLGYQSVMAAVFRPGNRSWPRDVRMPNPQVEAPVARGANLDVRGSVLRGGLARRGRCAKQHKREQQRKSIQSTHFCFSYRASREGLAACSLGLPVRLEPSREDGLSTPAAPAVSERAETTARASSSTMEA